MLTAAVSLGLPFLDVDYRNPNIDYEVSVTFLGGGSGVAGGDSDAPAGFPSYEAASRLLDPISSPMGFAPLVQIGFVIAALSVMRRRKGAILGLIGGAMGLLVALAIRVAIASEAAAAREVLGERLHVVLGPGSILVPLAFAGVLVWSIVRLTVGSQEGVARRPAVVGEETGLEPPGALRGVGWYLVALGALGLLSMATSDVSQTASQTGWRALASAVTLVAGFGLVAAKRWAYVTAVVLAALDAATVLLVLALSSVSMGASRLFVPFTFIAILFVVPFAFLLRRDCRAWFSRRDRALTPSS